MDRARTNNREASTTPDPSEWVAEYGDYLYNYAIFRVRDKSTAEELVQETFLAGLRGLQQFKGRATIKTWLTGILKHKIIDHYRKKNVEQPVADVESLVPPVDAFFAENGRLKMSFAYGKFSPGKLYEKKAFWETLYRCLAELPARLARLFTLREMDQMETEEICKELGVTATNSWVMLYRARLQMRRCLEINWFDKPSEEGK